MVGRERGREEREIEERREGSEERKGKERKSTWGVHQTSDLAPLQKNPAGALAFRGSVT
jgi:hypothetical protein